MVSRVHGNQANVFVADDKLDEIAPGKLSHWQDTCCARMVAGQGPCFAPDAQAIPAYASAPANKDMRIGAYIGQPLIDSDGTLLGTLCGVDTDRKPSFSTEQQFLVEAITRTMSYLIAGKLTLEQARQEEAKLRYQAERDALTGLVNRHGWEAALLEEEHVLSDLGEDAMVIMIDLDGLKVANDTKGHAYGDKYLMAAGRTLFAQLREVDVVARLGGDEFGAIIRNTSREAAEKLHERVRAAFIEAGVRASTGYALRLSSGAMKTAVVNADARMYEDKAERKAQSLLA